MEHLVGNLQVSAPLTFLLRRRCYEFIFYIFAFIMSRWCTFCNFVVDPCTACCTAAGRQQIGVLEWWSERCIDCISAAVRSNRLRQLSRHALRQFLALARKTSIMQATAMHAKCSSAALPNFARWKPGVRIANTLGHFYVCCII